MENENVALLQYRLKNILKHNSTKMFEVSNHGRVSPSRLGHYKTSDMIFELPIPNTGKEYKASLVIDVSGSMGTIRTDCAMECAKKIINLFYWIIDFNIITFGRTPCSVSINNILSYERWMGYNYFNYTVNEEKISWVKTLVQSENWRDNSGGTYWTGAMKKAFESLKNEQWDKFIVFITDWKDEGYEAYSNVCWINTSEVNKSVHRKMAQDYLEEYGINVLPVGIEENLSHWYDNSIEVSDKNIWNIYEYILSFMEEKFAQSPKI